jgi:hypothetical protein
MISTQRASRPLATAIKRKGDRKIHHTPHDGRRGTKNKPIKLKRQNGKSTSSSKLRHLTQGQIFEFSFSYTMTASTMRIFTSLALLLFSCSPSYGFAPSTTVLQRPFSTARFLSDESAPSDYDTADLTNPEQHAVVDEKEEDIMIRDELKRELLLLASVTNRGEYASPDERDIVIDLVTQLEALNPTAEPARNCLGEWDLCLSSTQFFRSSPFFQAIRVAVGDENKAMAENGFEMHDRATAASRVGRVRQIITDDKLVSEVDLEVGMGFGMPFKIKGTVVTSASRSYVDGEKCELRVQSTEVKGSNIPLLNQFMDDLKFELPVGEFYSTIQGKVPVVPLRVRTHAKI